MGVGHHFVPVFQMRQWATPRAVEFLPPKAPPKAREVHLATLQPGGRSRGQPVCLFSKHRVMAGLSPITCVPADHALAHQGLYALLDLEDPLATGYARMQALAAVHGVPAIGMREDQARRLATCSFDKNLIEKHIMSVFEAEAAKTMACLRQGAQLTRNTALFLLNYMTFSMVRTRGWNTLYAKPLSVATSASVRSDYLNAGVPESVWDHDLVQGGMKASETYGTLFHLAAIFHHRKTHLSASYFKMGFQHLRVVRTQSIPFILTDHPARPILPPGISTNHKQSVLPISPRSALVASSIPNDRTPLTLGDDFARIVNTMTFDFAFDGVLLPEGRLDVFTRGFDPMASRPFTEDISELVRKHSQAKRREVRPGTPLEVP
jgi:hypothetical protein